MNTVFIDNFQKDFTSRERDITTFFKHLFEDARFNNRFTGVHLFEYLIKQMINNYCEIFINFTIYSTTGLPFKQKWTWIYRSSYDFTKIDFSFKRDY